jgi:hypothetical protein
LDGNLIVDAAVGLDPQDMPSTNCTRYERTTFALAICALSACGVRSDDPSANAVHDTSIVAAPIEGDTAYALQLVSFSDSSRAVAFRDSLDQDGWGAFIATGNTPQGTRWRVYVLPVRSREVADQAMLAARVQKGLFADARLARVALPAGVRPTRVSLVVANTGSKGMASQVRWALSDDRRSVIAVEDAVAVEAEPVPNGVVTASEATGALLQIDQVWDAVPDPEWKQLAVSWAFVLQGGEATTIPRDRWIEWVRTVHESLSQRVIPGSPSEKRRVALADWLRTRAFSVSGMGVAYGLGFVQATMLDTLAAGDHRASRTDPFDTPVSRVDGWRVRWTRDGRLAIGVGMRGAQEFAPPTRWVLVNPASGDSIGVLTDTSTLTKLTWVAGPTIDFSQVHEMPAPRQLVAGPLRIDSRDGWIRLTTSGVERVIGPGQALATTATGRFIVAVAPTGMGPERHPMRLVVYRVGP